MTHEAPQRRTPAPTESARPTAPAPSRTASAPTATPGHSFGALAVERPPIQRLVGFEVEYRVPTYGLFASGVTFKGGRPSGSGETKPGPSVEAFLFGGLPYNTKIGGSADPGTTSFRITSDHNSAITREPVRAKLAELGKLDPPDTTDADASSNLEYVTAPIDELAKGSDKTLGTLIDDVATHAAETFTQAKAKNMSFLKAPAQQKYATGSAENKIEEWLSPPDFASVKPTIEAFRNTIIDECYLQATVGVLPSAIPSLFAEDTKADGILHTGGSLSQIYAAVNTASTAVGVGVKDEPYIKKLQGENQGQTLRAIGGLVRLLVMYLVGEALSQTDAFPGGTIKNAVPFLVKIDPSTLAGAGTVTMRLFDEIPDELVTKIAGLIAAREEITVDYWRGLGYAARAREAKDKVTAGTVANLTKLFLRGQKPPQTGVQTGGSRLPKSDALVSLESETDYQRGIPLEYRYIKERPKASALKPALLKIVAQARARNLSQVSEKKKTEIEQRVKAT